MGLLYNVKKLMANCSYHGAHFLPIGMAMAQRILVVGMAMAILVCLLGELAYLVTKSGQEERLDRGNHSKVWQLLWGSPLNDK